MIVVVLGGLFDVEFHTLQFFSSFFFHDELGIDLFLLWLLYCISVVFLVAFVFELDGWVGSNYHLYDVRDRRAGLYIDLFFYFSFVGLTKDGVGD